jgi:hypothetical protein
MAAPHYAIFSIFQTHYSYFNCSKRMSHKSSLGTFKRTTEISAGDIKHLTYSKEPHVLNLDWCCLCQLFLRFYPSYQSNVKKVPSHNMIPFFNFHFHYPTSNCGDSKNFMVNLQSGLSAADNQDSPQWPFFVKLRNK